MEDQRPFPRTRGVQAKRTTGTGGKEHSEQAFRRGHSEVVSKLLFAAYPGNGIVVSEKEKWEQ